MTDWLRHQERRRHEDALVSRYMREGASRAYAEVFARVFYSDATRHSPTVTGRTLAVFQQHRVPAEYALSALERGVDAETVHGLWQDGIPLEYVASALGENVLQ